MGDKRHIDVRPAQGQKLFGDPVAVQSLAAMVQATGVRLSPAIDRVKQKPTERENLEKNQVTYQFSLRKKFGSKLHLSLKPAVLFIQFRHS